MLGSWVWVCFVVGVLVGLNSGNIATSVIALCACGAAWMADRNLARYRGVMKMQSDTISMLTSQITGILQKSLDLTHAGWRTPDGEFIEIERTPYGTKHKIPPEGSVPLYLLPGPRSDKWRKPQP